MKDILNSDEDGRSGNEREVGSNATGLAFSKEILMADKNFSKKAKIQTHIRITA